MLSPSHSTPSTSDATSTALTVPNARTTTASGWTRRQGNRNATPMVTASDAPLHTRSSRANVSIVAATATTATSTQSRRPGPGGSAARGSAQ